MTISSDSISIRPLRTGPELEACSLLQRETWGQDFSEIVPASLMKVSQQVGAVAAGAFDPKGNLVGFLYGISGARRGIPAHWSHMLAVRPEARGLGLGRRLKEYQRDRVREMGIGIMFWTFDPLVARNANLNLNRLGAEAKRFVPDFYSAELDDEFHAVLGTDRFITVWDLNRGPVTTSDIDVAALPIVNITKKGTPSSRLGSALPEETQVLVEIPADVAELRERDLKTALTWRKSTQAAFLGYQALGYRVSGFLGRDGRFFYLLEHKDAE